MAIFPPTSERPQQQQQPEQRHGNPRNRPLSPDHHADLADRRGLDRDDAGHLRMDRAGLLRQHATGQEPLLRFLGEQCLLGTGRPAPVHLDGRDPVSHQAQRGDVRRPAPLAEPHPRPADAHHHPRVRHLRLGQRVFRRHLRHHRQGRLARAQEARLRRTARPGIARHRGHARHPDSSVHHHGGLRGGRRRLDHPHLPGGLPARAPADVAVHGLHRVVVDSQPLQGAGGRPAVYHSWRRFARAAT